MDNNEAKPLVEAATLCDRHEPKQVQGMVRKRTCVLLTTVMSMESDLPTQVVPNHIGMTNDNLKFVFFARGFFVRTITSYAGWWCPVKILLISLFNARVMGIRQFNLFLRHGSSGDGMTRSAIQTTLPIKQSRLDSIGFENGSERYLEKADREAHSVAYRPSLIK